MKLDMRVVEYYPDIKRIVGSLTATILLCQLLHWVGKQKNGNGYISKTSDELEQETGLTYYEQKTARKNLVDLGLIEEKQNRLYHTIMFKVLEDNLYAAFEKAGITASEKEPVTLESLFG